ncbi:MAG: hypothetical protein QXT86_12460 [Archaeoglobaceae archaeon]
MLASVALNNEERVVYTVPSGKTAMVFLHIFSPTESQITIKINNLVFFSGAFVSFISDRLILQEGDSLAVATDGNANVFVFGLEV